MRSLQCALVTAGLAAALVPVGAVSSFAPVGHYAAPSGTPTADGTRGRPWDLRTALVGGHGTVQPGDTIWLRGGRYPGRFEATLTGTSAAPIVVRQYAGERATLDGTLRVAGAHAIYWGFELMQSDPLANGNDALDTYGPDCAFVNLIVHDAGKQGISFWEDAGRSELYGSIFYNNGTHEGLDHGIYADNDSGEKWIVDNVVFDNLGYGIHVYAGGQHNPVLSNVHVRGNVAFNTGTISTRSERGANLLIGGHVRTERMTADSNLLYFAGTTGLNLRLGLPRGDNRDVVVRGNYVVGGQVALFMEGWHEAEVSDNRLAGATDLVDVRSPWFTGHAWHWSGNTFYRDPGARAWRYQGTPYDLASWERAAGVPGTGTAASLPTTAEVFVRPNRYEPGRGFIVIYNWGHAAAVAVDLSAVLAGGARYEIRPVEDLFGPPIVRGTYGGGSVPIPLRAVAPPRPIGRSGPVPPPAGPAFGVFLVTSRPR